jgi:CheY-like chemotaxis protein
VHRPVGTVVSVSAQACRLFGLPEAAAEVSGRVLYVDDDPVNQLLMRTFLTQRPGVDRTTVGDGAAAIAAALDTPPDLLLIDMMMPGMSGLQVMRAVRADPGLRRIRCVAVSANAMPDEIDAALAAGFDGYLTKPIASTAPLAEVDRCLRAGASRGRRPQGRNRPCRSLRKSKPRSLGRTRARS